MSDSEEVVFSQDPALNRGTVILRRDRVVLIEEISGERRERHIQLVDIADTIEMTERRFTSLVAIQCVFSAVFIGAAWKVFSSSWTSFALSLLFGSLAFTCVLTACISYEPTKIARVRSKRGEVLFELYRSRGVALPYEEFLLQFRRRLSSAREQC